MNIKNPSTIFFLAFLYISLGVLFSFFVRFDTNPGLLALLVIGPTFITGFVYWLLDGTHSVLFILLSIVFCLNGVIRYTIVDKSYFDKLKNPTEDEEDMLDLAFGLTQTSRLGCQIIMSEELDGLRVSLPKATRNMQVK